MTFIKCHRKVAKVFAIFVIDYTREIIKETRNDLKTDNIKEKSYESI